MKKQVYEQVRPPAAFDVYGWLLANADEPGVDDEPAACGVRWTVRLDDWYLTPAAGFIPRVRIVH